MGEWYELGLAAGLAVGAGVAISGFLAPLRRGTLLVTLAAALFGVALGLGVFDLDEAIAGAVGGLLGGAGAAIIAAGALKRGGTRSGVAALLLLAGALVAALAFVPVLGYLEVVVLLFLAWRIRSRSGGRYAGLRILAKD